MAQGAPASAACVVLAGTADGFDKETAVNRAQLALDDYIQQYEAENHLGSSEWRSGSEQVSRGLEGLEVPLADKIDLTLFVDSKFAFGEFSAP